MPRSRDRRTRERLQSGAPLLTAAERQRAERASAARRKRRLLRIGQALMAIGVVLGFVHVLAHMHVFGGPPTGLTDLALGYPMAGLLFITGAIMAGQ